MGFFDSFRDAYGGPTLYGPMKTAVTADVLEAGFLYAIAITAFSLLIILPGYRGTEKLFHLAKVVIGLYILSAIMLCNFGQEWEVAEIHTKTQYRAGLRREINSSIGVRIGLRSVNITLKAEPDIVVEFEHENETIDYNERFHWDSQGWVQGRAGFGPFAGLVNREFREAQLKGLPYPILWVAEYFTLDGEGVRWGRFYRQAGYYTHILIWLAFPMWIITLILFNMVIFYAASFSIMTGVVLVLANIIYAFVRNPFPLQIPFEDEHLIFTWGWCFWMNLITGLLCMLIGVVVIILETQCKSSLYSFFGVDIISDLEEYYATQDDLTGSTGVQPTRRNKPAANGAQATPRHDETDSDDEGHFDNNPGHVIYERAFRSRGDGRGTIASNFIQKINPRNVSRKYKQNAAGGRAGGPSAHSHNNKAFDDSELYENTDIERGHPAPPPSMNQRGKRAPKPPSAACKYEEKTTKKTVASGENPKPNPSSGPLHCGADITSRLPCPTPSQSKNGLAPKDISPAVKRSSPAANGRSLAPGHVSSAANRSRVTESSQRDDYSPKETQRLLRPSGTPELPKRGAAGRLMSPPTSRAPAPPPHPPVIRNENINNNKEGGEMLDDMDITITHQITWSVPPKTGSKI